MTDLDYPPEGLAAALDAVSRGLRVLPCAGPDSKRPAGRYASRAAAATPAACAALDWRHGVCVMLGREGTYVLDADDEQGTATVRHVGADTLRVRTPRGCHAYFVADSPRRQGCRVLPGVDGKGVAATGTPTVAVWWRPGDGRSVEHDAPIAPLPRALAARIGAPRAASTGGPLTADERALVARLALARSRVVVERADALRTLREAADPLRAELLGGSGWGHAFYAAAFRLGAAAAAGEYPLDDIAPSLWRLFQEWDELGEDPSYVRVSIVNGVRAGVRSGL